MSTASMLQCSTSTAARTATSTLANGKAIRASFDRVGKPHECMFVADEAHGYRQDSNVFDLSKRVDAFMKKHASQAQA